MSTHIAQRQCSQVYIAALIVPIDFLVEIVTVRGIRVDRQCLDITYRGSANIIDGC
jgi:hypothetical protein